MEMILEKEKIEESEIEEFIKVPESDNQIDLVASGKIDEHDPHIKYNHWKKKTIREDEEEQKRYNQVLNNLGNINNLDSFRKQNCSFQCLIDISKRQKGKDFYVCCYNPETQKKMVICRECAKHCHIPKHLVKEREALKKILLSYDLLKEKKQRLEILNVNKNRNFKLGKNENQEENREIEQIIKDISEIKLTNEQKTIAKEFMLAYEYDKYNCEIEKLEVEKKEGKFLDNYAEKNIKLYKISYKMNYELVCECDHKEIRSLPRSDNDTGTCTFTDFFRNTIKTTNFYKFEKNLLHIDPYKNKNYKDNEEKTEYKKEKEKVILNKYIEEMKMTEEKRKLLTEEGKAKLDYRQKRILTVDKLVTNPNEKLNFYCSFCVDNCIMPHFEFKKNMYDIPILIQIDRTKDKDKDVKCCCNQHDEYFNFNYRDQLNYYSLNFNFNVIFSRVKEEDYVEKQNDVEIYLQDYNQIDFNSVYFLHSLEVFRMFDLYYNSKYFLPNFHFFKNLNINEDNATHMHNITKINSKSCADIIEKETFKIIDAFCKRLRVNKDNDNNEDQSIENKYDIDYEYMNSSFSSKIILLYMIFYKTTKSFLVQKFSHFNINSIVNMTICQRYLYIYHNHKYIFKKELASEQYQVFIRQLFLFVNIFMSYMEQDVFSSNIDNDNDNYSLIHKLFKLVFKFNFSKIYNKNETNKIKVSDGSNIENVLEKKYLDLIHKTFLANKSKRKRCLSESSYYILKSIFYISFRLNDQDYYRMIKSNGPFQDGKNNEKIFYKGELSDIICKVTLMTLDNYDNTLNPERSLKFQLYSKYVLDVIIDKNKNYNIGINNLLYLKTSSFDVFLNQNRIINYIDSPENLELTSILDKMESLNWEYNRNEIEFNEYINKFSKFLNDLIGIAKKYLKPWNIDFVSNDLDIYKTFGNFDKSSLVNFQKIIKFNKFITVIDCFIHNYAEPNIKDIRKSKCRAKLPIQLRKELLIFFMALLYEDPENFNLIMNFNGKLFTNVFLQRANRENVNYTTNIFFSNKKIRDEWKNEPHKDEAELERQYEDMRNENISIDWFFKFLYMTSNMICYFKYKFINLKFFTDSMTETCKFIDCYRNDELLILKLLNLKKISNSEEIDVINNLLQDKFQFLQIYINHYKMTIGVSEEERAIYNKYLETEDNEDHLKILESIYDLELIDIITRQSIAYITLNFGKFLKIFCQIFSHLTLMKTESLDCLEHVVTILKNCSISNKIFKFNIEKFVKNRIPIYERDAIEVFMKYYLKFYCSVYYNSLSFMRIFEYDVIIGSLFNGLKKDYKIPEKLPLTLQMEIVKFTFTQIEIDFDLQQPIGQDIPFKSEYFWMAQKKPRFLYENNDKSKINPRLALTFALNSIKNCKKFIVYEKENYFFKIDENAWREKYWLSIEEEEKQREKIRYKDNGLCYEGNFYLKNDKSDIKLYRNCLRYYQNCCLKSMFFLTCFEDIYSLYESQELCAIVEIVTSFAETSRDIYNLILTPENYKTYVKNESIPKIIRKVYFNKLQFYSKFFLDYNDKTLFENTIKEKNNMKRFYFKIDENTRRGRKLLHSALKYKPFPIQSSTFDEISFEKLKEKYDNNNKLIEFFKNIRKLDKIEKKVENSKLSIIKVFENNEENIPLYIIFLDIVLKNLFTKISHFKLSNKEDQFKVNYYIDQKIFKMCYEELEWNNSIYIYFLNTVFSYSSNIFQLAFYAKLSQNEKELWTNFLIFLICFYSWNLSLHAVMRTRDLEDFRLKSSFIIDLNFSSVKILQNLCEGHNKTFQDFLFDFEFDVQQVKDLFWGKTIYISREEKERNWKYKIYNFINGNQLNLFNALKRRIYPKDKGILQIMQRYIDLIVEMIQGSSMKNLKTLNNRLRFLDERTHFENSYNYESVRRSFELLKRADSKLTDKKFFKKNSFHKNDDLNDKKLVKTISLEKVLKKLDLYEPENFDFYTLMTSIKEYLVNDFYLVDELVIRLQTCFFEYFNNILKSDIDQDKKKGVEVFTKFFKVEDIIILLMKYFIMIKYKYRHNTLFSQNPNKKWPNTEIFNENEIIVMNKPGLNETKSDFPEPKIIDLDEVFITEEEAKLIAEQLDKQNDSATKNENYYEDLNPILQKKILFKNVTYIEYKELIRIYKLKTGPLYYNLGKDVVIYDDPIFQTACKLMIYLKILAYKYQNSEASKILELNLSPYITAKKKLYGTDGKLIKKKDQEEQEDNDKLKEDLEDIKKINKLVKEVFDQYNFNSVSKAREYKYLPIIKEDEYQDTFVFCLQFFNKVILSCEFVFPLNNFEEPELIKTPDKKKDQIDSEDDRDEEEEEEDNEDEKKKMDVEEGKKKSNIKVKAEIDTTKLDKKKDLNELPGGYKTLITKNSLEEDEENALEHPETNADFIEEKIVDALIEDSDNEEIKKKKKKKKTVMNKKDKEGDEDENDEDWEIEKKKKEAYENELEEETNKDLINQVKLDENLDEKKESSKQLKKLHYIFDPKYYYKISNENINEFYENEADRSAPNNKISSLIDAICRFMIEIRYKTADEANAKSFGMNYFFDKKMYRNVSIVNFIISSSAVFYLFIFLDQMNYETIEVYYFIYGPLSLLILLNCYTIFMFLKIKYPYYKEIELGQLHINESPDFKLKFIDMINANYLNSFLLHRDVIFLIMNLVTSFIMLFRPNYIFLFCFQLFTIINFYPKVEEIFMAFYLKINQLLALIIFLAILLYVYSFLGFFFLQGEFDIDTDSVYKI